MIKGVNFCCDFLVFTRKEIHIKRKQPDVDFMKELGSNLSEMNFCYFHNLIKKTIISVYVCYGIQFLIGIHALTIFYSLSVFAR